jgi:hypothetical protein
MEKQMKTDHTVVVGELHQIEERIREDEGKSIKARREFGQKLLDQRGDNGRMPYGLLADVINKNGISRSEIHRRMQLAEKFKTDSQVSRAWDKYGSWRRLASEELPKTPRKEKPEKSWKEHLEDHLHRVMDTPSRRKAVAELLRAALHKLEADTDTVEAES